MSHRPPSSPPCDMPGRPPGDGASDVAAWRNAERRRLRALVRALDAAERAALDSRIAAALEELLPSLPAGVLAVYSALPCEPDLSACYERLRAQGRVLALPVVERQRAPLAFRAWRDNDVLEKDVLGIPVPTDGPLVRPAAVLLPSVGVDRDGFRLGAGGGYFDRTFADGAERPYLLGVCYSACLLPSIYPQEHDIRLQGLVTEEGSSVFRPPADTA